MPPVHPFFWNCHYCGKGHYASASTQPRYFFRVPPCHPYTHFLNCHCGKGHYASASNQPRYFFRVHHATAKPNFFRNCHYCGKGHYASASTQPGYFFRVPPRHPYTIFRNCRGKGALSCFDLAKVFLQGVTMPHLNPKFIFRNCHYCGKGHYASASTQPRYFFSVPL